MMLTFAPVTMQTWSDSIFTKARENQNSVLQRAVHPVCCGLHFRARADHRPLKPGGYTLSP